MCFTFEDITLCLNISFLPYEINNSSLEDKKLHKGEKTTQKQSLA